MLGFSDCSKRLAYSKGLTGVPETTYPPPEPSRVDICISCDYPTVGKDIEERHGVVHKHLTSSVMVRSALIYYLVPLAEFGKPRSADPALGREVWVWLEEQVKIFEESNWVRNG